MSTDCITGGVPRPLAADATLSQSDRSGRWISLHNTIASAGAAQLLLFGRRREDRQLGLGLSRVHEYERHAVLCDERSRRRVARRQTRESACTVQTRTAQYAPLLVQL